MHVTDQLENPCAVSQQLIFMVLVARDAACRGLLAKLAANFRYVIDITTIFIQCALNPARQGGELSLKYNIREFA